MRFFKRKTYKRTENTLSDRIAERVIRQQHLLAAYLNKKTNFLSAKGLLLALILFCMVFGAYCLYLIASAFS